MTPSRRRLVPVALLVAFGAACSYLTPFLGGEAQQPPPPETKPTATPRVQTSPLPTLTDVTGALSPETVEQMEIIEGQVVELRGLQPTGPVTRMLLPSDQLRQVVEEDLLEDYGPEEAADDARLLALFGLLEPGYDLWGLYHDLYTEQVAGFYDDEEGVMYVVQDAGFEGPERLTYAHEYVHALQDQIFDLDEGLGFNDEICETETERCAGVQALIEGDASLVEEQWFRTFATEEDREELMAFFDTFSSPVFDSAPAAIRESFIFPYEHGLEFVRWLERRGGWAEVDGAYADPPATTEQILHPARYPDDQPLELAYPQVDPETLGEGWRELDRGTLGEFDHFQVLAHVLSEEAAAQAAAGWGGDVFVAFHQDQEEQAAWVLIQSWDTIRDAQDAFLTWRDYAEARFGDRIPEGRHYRWESSQGHARLERASNQTLWITGPEGETVAALREAVEFPAPKR